MQREMLTRRAEGQVKRSFDWRQKVQRSTAKSIRKRLGGYRMAEERPLIFYLAVTLNKLLCMLMRFYLLLLIRDTLNRSYICVPAVCLETVLDKLQHGEPNSLRVPMDIERPQTRRGCRSTQLGVPRIQRYGVG